jgi:hypothetical protein
MIKRLMQRRKLVIGGCIFVAVVLGMECAGITPAQAASCEVSVSAAGDQMLSSSSDWTLDRIGWGPFKDSSARNRARGLAGWIFRIRLGIRSRDVLRR